MSRSHTFIVLIAFFSLSFCPGLKAQPVAKILKKYQLLNPAVIEKLVKESDNSFSTCNPKDDAFWNFLNKLAELEDLQSHFKGSARFSYHGDDTKGANLHQINAAINISRGIYPSEFEFQSSLSATLKDGQFQESFSHLKLSYDYFPSTPHPFLETFVFVDRYSDSFMRIDQRYEIGGGLLLNGWGSPSESGDSILQAIKIDLDSIEKSQWYDCWRSLNGKEQGDKEFLKSVKKDIKKLNDAKEEAKNTANIKYFKIRYGGLIGVFAEIEKASFSDSLLVNQDLPRIFVSQDFAGAHQIRWELRGTFEMQLSESWSFGFKPYIKFPMPWEWKQSTIREGEDTEVVDFRLDLITNLNIKIAESFLFHNGDLTVNFQHRYLWDNAPPRDTYLFGGENIPILGRNDHHILRMTVGVTF